MTTHYLGAAGIRKPDYADLRWDLPLNENWEIIAGILNATNNSNAIPHDRFELSLDGGLDVSISTAGYYREGQRIKAAAVNSFVLSDDAITFIYIDPDTGTIIAANSMDVGRVIPLYVLKTEAGAVVESGDLRPKASSFVEAYGSIDATGISSFTLDCKGLDVVSILNMDTAFTLNIRNIDLGRTIVIVFQNAAVGLTIDTHPYPILWPGAEIPEFSANYDVLVMTRTTPGLVASVTLDHQEII